jgi:hypothetical protein
MKQRAERKRAVRLRRSEGEKKGKWESNGRGAGAIM